MSKKRDSSDMQNKTVSLFCTECNQELDNFCFSNTSKNKNVVKKRQKKCLKSGKFNGEFCSKIFISDDNLLEGIWDKNE